MIFVVIVCAIFSTVQFSEGQDDIKYFISTQNRSETHILVDKSNITRYLNANEQITFIIHGFNQTYNDENLEALKDTLLRSKTKKVTIIQVSWYKKAKLLYPLSAIETKPLGKSLGYFISNLTQKGISWSNIHLIGFSLGAHLAGVAGKTVYDNTSKKLARITAVEPAGPGFRGLRYKKEDKLDKSDADIVVALHSDGRQLGYFGPSGHVDIYFNKGYAPQPGCIKMTKNVQKYLDKLITARKCDHTKALIYYIEALNKPGSMIAVRCNYYIWYKLKLCSMNKKIDVGGDFTLQDDGIYYLDTKNGKNKN